MVARVWYLLLRRLVRLVLRALVRRRVDRNRFAISGVVQSLLNRASVLICTFLICAFFLCIYFPANLLSVCFCVKSLLGRMACAPVPVAKKAHIESGNIASHCVPGYSATGLNGLAGQTQWCFSYDGLSAYGLGLEPYLSWYVHCPLTPWGTVTLSSSLRLLGSAAV